MHTLEIKNVFYFLLIGILPPISGAYLNATSMAEGLLLAISSIILLNIKNLKQLFQINKIIYYGVNILIIHSLIHHLIIGFFEKKSYISFLLIIFIVLGARFFSIIFCKKDSPNDTTVYFLSGLFILFAATAYISDFYLSLYFYGQNKGIFPFGEPSHFAIFAGPFFILSIATLNKSYMQYALLIFFFLLSFGIGSTTLFIYVILATTLLVRSINISTLFIIFFSVIVVYYISNNEYFTSRIALSSESTNLTSLVYLQGIEDAHLALKNTYGLGLGFQMLGYQPLSDASYKIIEILGPDSAGLNRFDGGFLAAKLIAEFGILGIFCVFIYLRYFFKSFFLLRKIMFKEAIYSRSYLFSIVFLYSFFVEMFVRGVGYFSASLFLFIASIFIFNKKSKRKKW